MPEIKVETKNEYQDCTAVTICNQNYLWGAILLIASFRYFKNSMPFLVCTTDLDSKAKAILQQFGNVQIEKLISNNKRNLTNRKAEALLRADSNYVAWIDVDCISVGDIGKYIIPQDDLFQIRLRQEKENTLVFAKHYDWDEAQTGIPRKILQIWCEDVEEKESPSLFLTCSACCMTFNRNLRNFIQRWDEQIDKVLPNRDTGTVDWRNQAYFQLDESVLNSLLVFSKIAPTPGHYQLDKDPNKYLVHFNLQPKPWIGWQYHHLKYFNLVGKIIDGLICSGFQLPPIPWSLKKENLTIIKQRANIVRVFRELKAKVRYLKYSNKFSLKKLINSKLN